MKPETQHSPTAKELERLELAYSQTRGARDIHKLAPDYQRVDPNSLPTLPSIHSLLQDGDNEDEK